MKKQGSIQIERVREGSKMKKAFRKEGVVEKMSLEEKQRKGVGKERT